MASKTVQLFLMDGTPDGPIKCSLSNWTGKVYLVPRTELKKLSREREDFNQNGVYFLFGIHEETERNMVYVGQASSRANGNGLSGRIGEHGSGKLNYFTHAILVTTLDDYLGPTDISYLEHRFHQLALDAARYQVANRNTPSIGNVTEEKEAELEEFIYFTTIAVGSLGYKIFQPVDAHTQPSVTEVEPDQDREVEAEDAPLLYFSGSDFYGVGRQVPDGFVLLKGSKVRPTQTHKCPSSRAKNLIKHSDSIVNYELVKDVLLGSPTSAAVLVSGQSRNGLISWKTATGVVLRDLE